jgi:hypothetical protein
MSKETRISSQTFFVVLGVELMASFLRGRHSTSSSTAPTLFTLVIFETGPCFMPGLA